MHNPSDAKKRVLILCTGNSCRSQIAEAWWRKLGGDKWDAYSAGSNPTGFVHPMAVDVMREEGIDISSQSSKHVDKFIDQSFDLVVTVCGGARESCPHLPGAKTVEHWPFDDPGAMGGDDTMIRSEFRRVRSELEQAVRRYLQRRASSQ